MEKMTYAMALETVIATLADGEVKDKLVALKAQMTKKSSAEKKPTKTQKENEVLATAILNEMEYGVNYRISDMVEKFASCENLSSNKVSALVRSLKDNKDVIRTEEKRVAYFHKA